MIELTEGQTRLRNAAKYLYKRWSTTPIRYADINDKLAYDKLVWLIHNFDEPVFVQQETEGEFFPEGWVDISDRPATATF